jgi:hypothetical protein
MFFINPFIYAGGGDYESIATVTVGSGGAASIEFTSIPSTYQHLQIRGILRGADSSASDEAFVVRLNGDTGSNYAWHYLQGNGSSASASAGSSKTLIDYSIGAPAATATASAFCAFVVDILDYASTSKATTVRSFNAWDTNGGGLVRLTSGLWTSTSAVTSFSIVNVASRNAVQYSTAALYGVKAP